MDPDKVAGRQIVVVGAGMAGLVAAVQAQELGADVVVLEKGDEPGGSMAMSGGTVWCRRIQFSPSNETGARLGGGRKAKDMAGGVVSEGNYSDEGGESHAPLSAKSCADDRMTGCPFWLGDPPCPLEINYRGTEN